MRRASLLVVIVLTVAACSGGADTSDSTLANGTAPDPGPTATSPPPTATGTPPIDLAGTRWTVTDYALEPGTITNVWKTEVTINFGGTSVDGSAGCNDYGATWSVSGGYDPFEAGQRDSNDGQVLVLADLSWTERACEDEDVMIQEAEILALLQTVGRWVIIRDELHLRDTDGQYLLQAAPA